MVNGECLFNSEWKQTSVSSLSLWALVSFFGLIWYVSYFKNRSVMFELTLDRNDELWDDGQDLGATILQHVMDPLLC